MNKKSLLLSSLLICGLDAAHAQFFGMNVNRDSIQKVTNADYADMIAKLGIAEPRPGRDPNNPDANRLPNYDELMANPFVHYPEALVTFDGRKVKNAKMWNKVRRPELVKYFEDEVYGHIPDNVPAVNWKVVSEEKVDMNGIACVNRVLSGVVDNSMCPSITVEIQASILYPEGAKDVPVIVEYGYMAGRPSPFAMSFVRQNGPQTESWQMMVVKRGWAAATIVTGSIQADGGQGLRSGIIGLCNKGEYRKPQDWGALRAWAWGTSKLIDYMESDATFDATKVAIEGVSRNGKASLVAMAFDQRIAAGFIASSGKGGAAGWRRWCGESVENLTSSGEYHWMAGSFLKYGAEPLTANDLKIDQHELIALCAPRPCLISAGRFDADKWQDVMGMFMMAAKASPVYELLGAKGLGTDVLPRQDEGLMDGQLAYRQHNGGHEAGPNWPYFLDFFQKNVVDK
ncbi:MAG: hypothetical protein KBS99_08915 [Prevotellaceae bacterium]|nr:hypothetical protein [Candidatus Colivivens caballi]